MPKPNSYNFGLLANTLFNSGFLAKSIWRSDLGRKRCSQTIRNTLKRLISTAKEQSRDQEARPRFAGEPPQSKDLPFWKNMIWFRWQTLCTEKVEWNADCKERWWGGNGVVFIFCVWAGAERIMDQHGRLYIWKGSMSLCKEKLGLRENFSAYQDNAWHCLSLKLTMCHLDCYISADMSWIRQPRVQI